MTLNIKPVLFLPFIVLGSIFFYDGYENLIQINNLNETLKNEVKFEIKNNENIINKKINNKINNQQIKNEEKLTKEYEKYEKIVSKGDTFSSILKNLNISDRQTYEIISKIDEFFDLRFLKENQKIIFYKNDKNEIKKIEISQNIDTVLLVTINDDIEVKQKKFEKIYFEESNQFNITESLYSDGLKNGLPQDILIKLIRLFSFDLDFQRDIKKNTIVSISYDYNQFKENDNVDYIDINYALISINGKKLEYFKFLTDDGYVDYFNREGKNVKKSLLKTPLDGARISSNFGMRKHPISGYNKMHKGVDFAAPTGTPIYAGGNCVVEYVGNNGGYGKYIRIRHNNEYKTAYAHLSGYKKGLGVGSRVNQGDVIGYVGSTGISTGPHLHYEIIFQNKQINPLKLKLPSGKILKGQELERFVSEMKTIYANHLNLLFE